MSIQAAKACAAMVNKVLQPDVAALAQEKIARKKHVEEQARYQISWNKSSKKPTPYKRYKKVAVLMLYWQMTDFIKKDYEEEIAELSDVFKNDYGFEVFSHMLECSRKAEQSLATGLGPFMYQHDGEDTLLIIYYGGHGFAKGTDFLLLDRRDIKAKAQISWTAAEEYHIQPAVADVLAIFDCCDAGSLCDDNRDTRGIRNFEYLTACRAHARTRAAGERSFTKALIWALLQLKESLTPAQSWFSVADIRKKIRDAPNLPKKQWPQWGQRDVSYSPIILAPANELVSHQARERRDEAQESMGADCKFLDVRLRFPRGLTDEAFEHTAETVQQMITEHTTATEVSFLQMTSNTRPSRRWEHVKEEWRERPWIFNRPMSEEPKSPGPHSQSEALLKALLPPEITAMPVTPASTDCEREHDEQEQEDARIQSQSEEPNRSLKREGSTFSCCQKHSLDDTDPLEPSPKRLREG